jgi:hypothetical protein
LQFLATAKRHEQEINGIQIRKEEVKLSPFADDMILYLKDPKNSTKTYWKSSVAFLYTNNEQSEKEIRETIPFTIVSKSMKYLRINLTKETKDLFNENYKPLKREIKEDIRRWKDLPYSWISIIK